MRAALPLVVVALGAGRAAAQDSGEEWMRTCHRNSWGRGEMFCDVRSSRMAAGGALTVDARDNGGVRVIGSDGNEVRIEARVQARAESEAEARALAQQVHVVAQNGSIRSDGPRGTRERWWSVSYTVWVPRHQDVTVSTTNGPVSVDDVRGRMDLRAVNGPLTLTHVAGDVRGRTDNGPIRVRLSGARWDGGGLDVQTTNGSLTLSVPEGFAAHLDVSNVNGPMSVDFPVTVNGRIGHHIVTDLGGGGPTIRAATVNGPVSVSRN
jgi:DUF4097 and DUF4098 domain-containing protein YvlB